MSLYFSIFFTPTPEIMDIEEFKIALVGDTGVGKTCITVRFVTNTFNIA